MTKEHALENLKMELKKWYNIGGYIYCLGMTNAWAIAQVINYKTALELDAYLATLLEEDRK